MRVLILGGTSYVASHFAKACAERNWTVYALVRDRVRHAILSSPETTTSAAVGPDEVASLGSAQAIINFGFPKDQGGTKAHVATLRLIEGLVDAARLLSPRVVVHVSTQSVFGYTFGREPRPVPVWWATGDTYVETKLLAEWLFMLKTWRPPYARVVLRLGNVIGPGAYWTAEIARRILLGDPLGNGASNATYVRNVVDYLNFLVSSDQTVLRQFGLFHHLAEFSSYRWPRIAEPLAEALGARALYADRSAPSPNPGATDHLKTAARYLLMLLPKVMRGRLEDLRERQRLVAVGAEGMESILPETLVQPMEFRSHTLPDWQPPFDLDAALTDSVAWLRAAGYVARPHGYAPATP